MRQKLKSMTFMFQSSSEEDEWVEKDSKKDSDVPPLKKSNNEGSQVHTCANMPASLLGYAL